MASRQQCSKTRMCCCWRRQLSETAACRRHVRRDSGSALAAAGIKHQRHGGGPDWRSGREFTGALNQREIARVGPAGRASMQTKPMRVDFRCPDEHRWRSQTRRSPSRPTAGRGNRLRARPTPVTLATTTQPDRPCLAPKASRCRGSRSGWSPCPPRRCPYCTCGPV